jgi:hypothetical protein
MSFFSSRDSFIEKIPTVRRESREVVAPEGGAGRLLSASPIF